MKKHIYRSILTFMLVAVTPLLAAWFIITADDAFAAESANGGTAASNNTEDFAAALGSNADVNQEGSTLTVTINNDIDLAQPLRIVKGAAGDKVVINLNGHTIKGAAGTQSADMDIAKGGNAIEIAADEFDVEIGGKGSVIGGKGAQYLGGDYRYGAVGGSAVFFCERIDKLHGIISDEFVDEGYRPDKLEYGLTVSGDAALIGGAGADATYDDWLSNASGAQGDVIFSATAGDGGAGIGQVRTGLDAAHSFDELSYAKIVVSNGTVAGGLGGNVNTGDQFFTTTDIQKISAIQQFMSGKDAATYDFDSYVTDNISFCPGTGGNGIEFFAGRKYVDIENDGVVSGGDGGKTVLSEEAAMVKRINTKCGDGGMGLYVCGDTGLTNNEAALSDTSGDADYWGEKSATSDDVGIYVSGTVKGGSSPETTLLNDSSGNGGEGIHCELDGNTKLCESYQGASFDADRGIVLVDRGGKVIGGDSGSSESVTISGGNGADAITGGSTGSSANSSPKVTAGHFIIEGNVFGGYGSSFGGNGIALTHEREYINQEDSAYFVGYICGDGTVRGGDSGVWPYLEENSSYTMDASRIVCDENGQKIINGIYNRYTNHDGSLTISSTISEETGDPPRVMAEDSSFKVSAEMSPFTGAPDANTKLRCTVTNPSGYNGKTYIQWYALFSGDSDHYGIEGANGKYNNFNLLSDSDYPYGIHINTQHEFYENKVDIATYNRMAYQIRNNNGNRVTIFCIATLEDGRFIKSNEIWFTKAERSSKGWIGGNSGSDSDADQVAADHVQAMIDALPLLDNITLADADAIATAREAYEALTDAQKELLAPYTYLLDDLGRAEAKIADLITAAEGKASDFADLVLALDGQVDAIDPDSADAADAVATLKGQIEAAIAAYNELSNDEKTFVSEDVLNNLTTITEEFNTAFPDSAIEDDIVPYEPPQIALTANMVTLSQTSYTYNGKARTPAVTVKCDGETLVKGTDYKVTYSNNKNAGKANGASAKVEAIEGSGYTGTVTKTFTINKANNPLAASGKTATLKAKKLKKKNQYLARTKVLNVSRNQGRVTYVKASGNKKITINKTTGKVTVKKKLKKGTYKVKVRVIAAGNGNYKALTRIATFTIKVKK